MATATSFMTRLQRQEKKNEKMNLWDFIKIKSFCSTKETVKKTKKQPTEWEKIFAKDTTEKGLVSEIYKEILKLNTRETNNQKMGRRYEQTLFQ